MDSIRVLIVDDESHFVDTLVERLRMRGFDTDGVNNGTAALECLDKKPYDILLLDVKMPGSGGLEVIKEVKERWPGLRVVMLTGYGSSQDAEEGMRLGAFKYVMKPVNIDNLIGIFWAALESRTKVDE